MVLLLGKDSGFYGNGACGSPAVGSNLGSLRSDQRVPRAALLGEQDPFKHPLAPLRGVLWGLTREQAWGGSLLLDGVHRQPSLGLVLILSF